MKYVMIMTILLLLYVGSYALARAANVLGFRYVMTHPQIELSFRYLNGNLPPLVRIGWAPCIAVDAMLDERGDPGKDDLGPTAVAESHDLGFFIGCRSGNPSTTVDARASDYCYQEVTGYWNPTLEQVRAGLYAMERTTSFTAIAYATRSPPPWGAAFASFTSPWSRRAYAIQAIGVYHRQAKRILFNLGNQRWASDVETSRRTWALSTELRHVYDGGSAYVRFSYDVDDLKIHDFDSNGEG